MYAKYSIAFCVPLFLAIVLNGCTTTTDQIKAEYFNGDETITYGQAFAVAFQSGVWSEGKDEQGAKIAQFTGKISPGLHGYAVGILEKRADRIIFSSALSYLAALIQKGETHNQPLGAISIQDYPISKQGNLFFDSLEDYVSSPDNQIKIQRLNAFYKDRYWTEGSECIFQWKVYARGKMSQVVRMSNKQWDDDGMLSNKPENVLKVVFDYAKSVPR